MTKQTTFVVIGSLRVNFEIKKKKTMSLENSPLLLGLYCFFSLSVQISTLDMVRNEKKKKKMLNCLKISFVLGP